MGVICSSGTSPSSITNGQTIVRPHHSMEIYYSPYSPPSRAVLLTVKALGIQPEMRELDLFQKAEHKQPWFRKINPTHTVPAISDDGFTLTESRAILAYLVNQYGKKDDPLYPTEARKRALVDRMLYFDMGSVYKSITEYWHPQIFGGQSPDSQKENVLKQSLEYLDGFLNMSPGKYAAGDSVTIADFSLLSSITSLEVYDYDYESYPIITSWAEGLKKELPYYQECMQDGLDKAREFLQNQEG